MRVALILLLSLSLCACKKKEAPLVVDARPAPPKRQPDSLLGGERGFDHFGVGVRDLDIARESYKRLGFARPSSGTLPNGVKNVNYYFQDMSYLETLTHYDDKKAPWLARFVEKHEGARFFVLAVYSADETTTFLKKRGFEMQPPFSGTIQVTGSKQQSPSEMWKTLFFKKSPFAADSLFFIAYDRKMRDTVPERLKDPRVLRRLRHPNTAIGLRAAWIAVQDIKPEVKLFERLGLPAGKPFKDMVWGVEGQAIDAGEGGKILVVQPSDPKNAVALMIKRRFEKAAIIGVSIGVRRLEAARNWIQVQTKRTFATYPGQLGRSMLITPDLTHGVWLEFVETR
jgi:hypothetical protein